MVTERTIYNAVKSANPHNPIDYVTQIVKPLAIESLREAIRNCYECPIANYERSLKTLPRGTAKASVLIIGDFPTENQFNFNERVTEVYENANEWYILQKIIAAYNINPDSLFFINAVNCLPMKELNGEFSFRPPNSQEVTNCQIFIDYAFKTIDPVLVILLGNYALNAVKEDVSLAQKRGEFINVRGITAMPTYSPSYLIQLAKFKDPAVAAEYKADFCDDILKAFLWLQEEYPDNNVLLKPLQKQ